MQFPTEINKLSNLCHALTKMALENNYNSYYAVIKLSELCEGQPEAQKYIKAALDQADPSVRNDPHYLFLQGLTQQLATDNPPDFAQVAENYRQAMIQKFPISFAYMARLISDNKYLAGPADFNAAGITDPGGDSYKKAAGFFRQAMIYKDHVSYFYLGVMIYHGRYIPQDADFSSAGITDLGEDLYKTSAKFFVLAMINEFTWGFDAVAQMILDDHHIPSQEQLKSVGLTDLKANKFEQAAAFLRAAKLRGSGHSNLSLAILVYNKKYILQPEDFKVYGITEQGSNIYHQAVTLIYDTYIKSPIERKQAIDTLNQFILQSVDNEGHAELGLCRISLLLRNDLKSAKEYFDKHPNKEKALELLIAEVISRLDIKKLHIEITQRLLDFVIEHGAEAFNPFSIHYIQLKCYYFKMKKLRLWNIIVITFLLFLP